MAAKMGFVSSAKRSISDALIALRKPARVLVFGSLYLAGEALSLNGSLPD
jgi:folylpolyglutamate synthase/dihydropteroate synthase